MKTELFFFVLYFWMWMLVSLLLGPYEISADVCRYPAAWPYVTLGFILLSVITVIRKNNVHSS